ncbi:MAG: MarR family transcriptional regulator [bacterium]|nr:MarR family transcriptional regulator [bacterium]
METQQYRLFHDIYVFLDAGDSRALEGFHLTPSQFSLLMLLDPFEGHNLIRLAERLLVARSTITRLIDQLELLGIVHRVSDPNDRRAQQVRLTEKGSLIRERALIAHERSLNQRFGVLSIHEQETLVRLLKRLRDGLIDDVDKA